MLVAVDANLLRGKDVDALSRRLLAAGAWAADMLKGELHVMHAWDSFGEGQLRRAGVPLDGMKSYRLAARNDAMQELLRVVEPFKDRVPVERLHLEKGDPRTAIPRFAEEQEFDLLVMGTVGRSGLARLVIGNTVESVLASMPCSMLVVRPEKNVG